MQLGEWGEDRAAKMLQEKQYKIIGRRVRVGKHDEVDLLARTGKILVFVEVKTRSSEYFNRPIDAVDRRKKENLRRAASRYVKKLKKKPDYIRFDVVEVIGEVDEVYPIIRHIENAFQLGDRYRIHW